MLKSRDILRILNDCIEETYANLSKEDTAYVDKLCLEMQEKKIIRNMGIKSYRELLVKTYLYLTYK